MTWSLGRDHRHVHIGRWGDETEANVESMREEQRLPGGQVRCDRLGVQRALHRVRGEHHDDVRPGRSLRRGQHRQPRLVRLGPALRPLDQADHHLDARVAQTQRVSMPLAARTRERRPGALNQTDRSASAS